MDQLSVTASLKALIGSYSLVLVCILVTPSSPTLTIVPDASRTSVNDGTTSISMFLPSRSIKNRRLLFGLGLTIRLKSLNLFISVVFTRIILSPTESPASSAALPLAILSIMGGACFCPIVAKRNVSSRTANKKFAIGPAATIVVFCARDLW